MRHWLAIATRRSTTDSSVPALAPAGGPVIQPHRCVLSARLPLFLAAASVAWAGATGAQSVSPRRLTVEPYVGGLQLPTGFVFLADDDVLVIEKNTGRVRRVLQGQVAATVLELRVNSVSERGGLGIEIDPEFASTGYVYIYYSAATGGKNGGWTENIVARYRWNGTRLISPKVLLTFPSRARQANGPNHDGGTLRFGPDGQL